MKKIFAALLIVALGVVSSYSLASESVGGGIAMQQLQWRRSLAAVVGGYTDSSYISTRAPVTTAFVDTTAPMSTSDFSWSGLAPTGTVYGIGKIVLTTATSAATQDTLFVTIQGSVNGDKWSTCTTTALNALGPQSTSSSFACPLAVDTDIAIGSAGSVAWWPYIRLIVQGDNNVVSTMLRAYVIHSKKENN